MNSSDPIYVFGSSNQGSDQTARMTQLYQAVNSVEVIFLSFLLLCAKLLLKFAFSSQKMLFMFKEKQMKDLMSQLMLKFMVIFCKIQCLLNWHYILQSQILMI